MPAAEVIRWCPDAADRPLFEAALAGVRVHWADTYPNAFSVCREASATPLLAGPIWDPAWLAVETCEAYRRRGLADHTLPVVALLSSAQIAACPSVFAWRTPGPGHLALWAVVAHDADGAPETVRRIIQEFEPTAPPELRAAEGRLDLVYGQRLLREREFADAEAVFRRILTERQEDELAWYRLILALFRVGRRAAEALETLSAALAHFPGSLVLPRLRASSWAGDELGARLAAHRRVHETCPDDWQNLALWAELEAASGNHREADELRNHVLTAAPWSVAAGLIAGGSRR